MDGLERCESERLADRAAGIEQQLIELEAHRGDVALAAPAVNQEIAELHDELAAVAERIEPS